MSGTRSQGGEVLLFLLDPGEIRLLSVEATRHGVNQYVIGGSSVQTTCFFEGQDPFDPPIPLGTGCPQRALAPEDAKAQGALRT